MKTVLTTTLVAAASMLSACGPTGTPANRSVASVNQPVVQRADYVLDLGTGGVGLASGEIDRLADWFETIKLGYGDRVAIDFGGDYGNPDVSRVVGGVAARYGMLLSNTAPVTAGDVPSGSVRVVVSRMRASVPGCPDWSRRSQPEYAGATTSNYGCATNGALAAMIANPQDLVEGRTSSDVDALSTNNQTLRAIAGQRANSGKSAGTVNSEGVGK